MQKTRTRLWSVLLTVAMLLTLLPTTALADGEDTEGGTTTGTTQEDPAPETRVENPVAEIKSTGEEFETLAGAIAAAEDGDTVELLTDATVMERILLNGKNLTIDTNGCSVTYSGDAANAQAIIDLYGNSEVTITGDGAFTIDDNYLEYNEIGYTFRIYGNSRLTIENGTYYAGLTCVQAADNAIAYIEGGDFSASTDWNDVYWLLNLIDNSQAKFVVTGGSFENFDPAYSKTENPVANFCAEGYISTSTTDGKNTIYTVVALDEENSVAKVTGSGKTTYFETLPKAVAAAKDGETVTLLKDASGDGVVVPSGSNIVIDFAGYTYDIDGTTVGSTGTETNGFQLLKNSTIEFRNGTLTSSKAKILIQNYSDLTLKDMTLDGTGLSDANPYVVSNNCGNVTITGDTSIIAAPGGVAFDVYYWPAGGYGEGVSVTLNTTGTITGNIEYGSDGTDDGKAGVAENARLSIKQGAIKGNIITGGLDTDGEANIAISGGTFSTSVAQYVTEDLKYELNNGNAFTYYPTLSAALANAESGAVINDLTEEGSEDPISVAIVTFDPGNGDKDWSVTLISGNTVARPDAPSRAGYRFTGWYVDGYEYDFDTPVTRDITITAGWKKIGSTGSTEPTYMAALEKMTNGSAVVSPKQAQEGDEVTITVTPDAGYVVDEVIVTDAHGDDVRVYEEGNNVYTFTMPDSRVTIEVTFKAKETAPAVPTAPAGWVNPFADVAANAWYYDAVGYANANGLMGGTSATTFAPNGAMNRSMVWTVIARLAGQTISGATWAEDAKAWAAAQGVSDGTNPDGNVTREELVTMLYRYIGSPVMNVPELGLINSYPDAASVSDWAQNALAWALSRGIIDGRDGKLASGESVTRAEAATILARFHLLTK